MYDRLSKKERAKDPLREGAQEMAQMYTLSPGLGEDIFQFAKGFFDEHPLMDERLLEAVCLMCNISWRDHPNYRRGNILHTVLYAPLDGLTHKERILIALCLYFRYGGESSRSAKDVAGLVSADLVARAKTVGAFLRFANALVGQAPDILSECALLQSDKDIRLKMSKRLQPLNGEAVETRLQALGELVGKPVRVVGAD